MPTDSPLVSIIIPTYNRAHLIGETLDSVLAQTYQNWECIVVDDGSTDNTDELMAEYVQRDYRFKYYHRPKEHLPGGNGARNYGFKMSKGEYVQWFDSDDLMVQNKLELAIKAFNNKNINVVFSCHGIQLNKNKIENVIPSAFGNNLPLFKNMVRAKIKIHSITPVWKKIFLTEKELFDEKIKKGQELDFYTRTFFNTKINYVNLNITTAIIRPQKKSILQDFYRGKNVELIKSFLEVRKRIHLMVLNTKDMDLFFDVLKFHEAVLIKLIKHKHFNLLESQIHFLTKNPPSVKNKMYKLKIYRYFFFSKIMQLTNGKGYYKIKNYLSLDN